MTLQTIAVERSQHAIIMRLLMAITTVWNRRVLHLMTESTIESSVLSLALGQHLCNFSMTSAAILGLYVIGVLNIHRAVRFVATQAIFIGQEIGMRLMAFQTFLNLLMLRRMTERAVLGGMNTREVFELFTFIGMASLAGNRDWGHIIDRNI